MLTEVNVHSSFSGKQFAGSVSELASRIEHEMDDIEFFMIEPSRAEYFDGDGFGVKFAAQFPSVGYEIAEAGKCYALDRSTASAFHCLRCLESAIRAIGRCLGIPDPTSPAKRNWAIVLETIKNETDRRWTTTAQKASGDGKFFDEMYAILVALKNPYRNPTMHLESVYTPEDAKHLYEMVRGFMVKIASRMNEDGLPLA